MSVTFAACSRNQIDLVTAESEHIRISTTPYCVPTVEESYIPGEYGVYESFFAPSDNIVGLSSTKSGPLNEHIRYGYSMPSDNKEDSYREFDVSLNGNRFPVTPLSKAGNDLEDVFGNNAEFMLRLNTKAGQGEETVVNMYVPQEIAITRPAIQSEEDLLPLCYYSNFQIGWNADSDNGNGVIAIVEWIGEVVVGSDIPSTHIRRICVFEDTGEGTFDDEMFDGIPDTAVCHLTLLRGNMEFVEMADISYKIFGESHEFLTFVLIREIKNKSKDE